jgi:hypothetical protein
MISTESDAVWQKCSLWLPMLHRDIHGQRLSSVGQVWRRRRPDGKWEYRQDAETFDEWSNFQW